jgi:ABC-type multidrug transport system fused ATPase/permease subunit
MAQPPHLFDETIEKNVIYSKPDAAESEMLDTTERVGIHSVITSLEKGYNTMMGEDGGYVFPSNRAKRSR